MKKQFKRAVEAIRGVQRIALACHVNPDGDALGSILALTHVLRSLGKEAIPFSADGVPDIYSWMPGAEWVRTIPDSDGFPLAIVCDAGALERVGRHIRPVMEAAPVLIDIDHHVADGVFGTIQVVDSKAAATAEIVYRLIRALSVAAGRDLMTKEVAECLLTGVITDTGSFRYLNVTPQTFLLAARLQRLGALPAPIAERVFEDRSLPSLKLAGRVLDALQVTPDGLVAWAQVKASDFEELGAKDVDTEGIINFVRSTHGAHVGILFREVPGGKVRISLRAREGADVNKIANVFGGGGHKLAAGCSLEPPLEEVVKRVLAETHRQLTETG